MWSSSIIIIIIIIITTTRRHPITGGARRNAAHSTWKSLQTLPLVVILRQNVAVIRVRLICRLNLFYALLCSVQLHFFNPPEVQLVTSYTVPLWGTLCSIELRIWLPGVALFPRYSTQSSVVAFSASLSLCLPTVLSCKLQGLLGIAWSRCLYKMWLFPVKPRLSDSSRSLRSNDDEGRTAQPVAADYFAFGVSTAN